MIESKMLEIIIYIKKKTYICTLSNLFASKLNSKYSVPWKRIWDNAEVE